MKLQNILSRLQKLHPKEIDLSLDRVLKLCNKLGNPQDHLKVISVVGTNGKNSTIQAMRAMLNEAKIKTNIYTSPHIKYINERFVFDNHEISEEKLIKILQEVEEINNKDPITYFEFLTAVYLYEAKKYPKNLNIIEAGLFHRFDATNVFKRNLASIICAIGIDHTDWLPVKERTIDKIIYEKTSSLLNSKIIISKQTDKSVEKKIKNSLIKNKSKKLFFNNHYSYMFNENGFFYYEDKFGGIKLPMPNVLGEYQLSNISTAICALRNLDDFEIGEKEIIKGITKINNIGRLQELKSGKLKDIIKENRIYIDGSHNVLGAKVLSDYLKTIQADKHVIIGMMANKDHKGYVNCLKSSINSLICVDIPNQPNSIKGKDLKNKIDSIVSSEFKSSIIDALKSIKTKKNDVVLITGSLYLAGEVLTLN